MRERSCRTSPEDEAQSNRSSTIGAESITAGVSLLYSHPTQQGSLEKLREGHQNARLLELGTAMEYFGWIVLGAFGFSSAYLLYAIEKGTPWALGYVQTLASVDPAARRFPTRNPHPGALPEQDSHYKRYVNEPWWVYM